MATSLVGGLIAAGATPASIVVAEPDAGRRSQLTRQFGISATDTNLEVLQQEIVVLSVKPQLMQTVCRQLAASENAGKPLYVSIAAGIRTTDIARWLGTDADIIRCMPNTPALIQCGATALYADQSVSDAQKQQADEILRAAGITTWVDNEDLLDAVTAISGSGPAYYFLLMEAMQKAAISLGLDKETANKLTWRAGTRVATEKACMMPQPSFDLG